MEAPKQNMTEPTNIPPTPFDRLLHEIRQIVREELVTAHTNGSNMMTTTDTLLTAKEASALMNVKPIIFKSFNLTPGCCHPRAVDHFAEEIADVQIRLLDLVDGLGIDLDRAVADKLEVNRKRGFHHGGQKRI
jgi:NTP pyrophosphatase (non-canonical NTP hydrolase)